MFAKPKAVKLMDGTPLSNLLTVSTTPTAASKTATTKLPVTQQPKTVASTQKTTVPGKKQP